MAKKTESPCCHRYTESGLSLIEVCILLFLFSLLLIPALQVMSLERKAAEIAKHNGTTIDLANALTNYALENGAYPIPAAPRLAFNDPKVFMPATGTEIPTNCGTTGTEGQTALGNDNGIICRPRYTPGDAVTNAPTNTTLVEREVYVGTLPVSVLGLPPEQGLDENGHKFTYIVNRILTNRATFDNAKGSIIVSDLLSASWVVSTAQFAIISHGQNGVGGWTRSGTLLGTVGPGGCQWVGTTAERGNQYQCKKYLSGTSQLSGYVHAIFKTGTSVQVLATNDALGTTFYDDSVAFKTTVYGRLWTPRDDGTTPNEYFSAKGNVGIGFANITAGPAQKLTLGTGNVRTIQAAPTDPKATVKSPQFCNAASSSCFKPDDIATNAGSTAPLYCASSVGLKGVNYTSSAATKDCYSQPVRTAPLTTCALGIKGFQTTGEPICAP